MPADPPATGAGAHVDPDTLAQLDEGLLTPTAGSRIREHVAACPSCSARLAAVVGVRTALAAAPPERLPTAVGARLDAALAKAAREPAVVAVRPRWAPRLNGGLLAAGAAASIVLLLFGALVLGVLRGGGGSSNGAGTNAASKAGGDSPARVPTAVVTASGRNYNAATLRAALPGLLGVAAPAGASKSSADVRARPTQPANPWLGACVRELAGGAAFAPLAVDRARYGGKPATVVVLPEAGRPATLDVWVVGPGCTRGDPQVIDFTRLPRPAGIPAP